MRSIVIAALLLSACGPNGDQKAGEKRLTKAEPIATVLKCEVDQTSFTTTGSSFRLPMSPAHFTIGYRFTENPASLEKYNSEEKRFEKYCDKNCSLGINDSSISTRYRMVDGDVEQNFSDDIDRNTGTFTGSGALKSRAPNGQTVLSEFKSDGECKKATVADLKPKF